MTKQPAPKRSRVVRAAQSLLLLSISTVICLLLTEVGIRAFRPQFLRPVVRERIHGVLFTRANLHARIYSPGEFDTVANTTAQRFRANHEYDPDPGSGVFRIAVIGDSFVFGSGANDTETYPAVLENALSALAGSKRVEVLNAGIPNSGTGDQALWYEDWVRRFHPDTVVLTVYGGNDVVDEIHESKFVFDKKGRAEPLDEQTLEKRGGVESRLQTDVMKIPGYNYLTQHSELLYAVRTLVTTKITGREYDFENRPPPPGPDVTADEAIAKIVGEIKWLNEQVTSSGSELVVVFIPPRDEFLTGVKNSLNSVRSRELAQQLGEETERAGIPYLDITSKVEGELSRAPGTLYYQHDTHMRPDGYRLVAKQVAGFLKANKVIG